MRPELEQKEIVIFGTGFLADMFYTALEANDLQDHVRFCLVTKAAAGETFRGLPVYGMEECPEISEGMLVCIAVHEALLPGVQQTLQAYGIPAERTVWITPYLTELLYGECIREGMMPLKELMCAQDPENNWITVRYAAMREYTEGTGNRYKDLYIRAQSLHTSAATAAKRYEALKHICDEMRKGYDASHPVLIDEDLRIIDGLHRTAAALLCGVKEIPYRMYRRSPVYDRVLKEENRLRNEVLLRAGFAAEDIQMLKQCKEEMAEKVRVMEEKKVPEISVIIPVYNVEDYIDTCMESLAAQTYTDFEVLLINDGSTDHSADHCRKWAEKDSRIRFIDKVNEGVSASRNLGIDEARGTYLSFIDPDDWVDSQYFEKLHEAAVKSGADYTECDLWRYDNRSGKKIYRACYGRMGVPYTRREHMRLGPTATYKALTKRSLWNDHHVRMPSCSFESPAVYSLLLALSNKIENVREPLYYYRRFRENSLIETGYAAKDGKPDNAMALDAMRFLIGEYKRCGIYEEYKDTLEGIVTYRLSDILATQFYRKREEDYLEQTANYRAFLKEMFPEEHAVPYLSWGGYNLNRILAYLNRLHDPYCRFNFSSLISLLGNKTDESISTEHRNRYRHMMLEREKNHAFETILKEVKPAYLFVNLIEERFDILAGDGFYVTDSDAFQGRSNSSEEHLRRIPRDSDECTKLFRKAAEHFTAMAKEAVPGIRIVIVEDYLAETVGDLQEKQEYAEIKDIRRTNAILQDYYAYMKEICPEALVVSGADDPLYFTDRNYEYGAVPSHLNEIMNQKIAEMIEEKLK